MNRIKTETGTSIIIPPDNEHNDVIRIEGDPKGVAAAKTMLLELATKMVSCVVWRRWGVSIGLNVLYSSSFVSHVTIMCSSCFSHVTISL